MIASGQEGKKSLGADTLLTVSQAELIDSVSLYEDYLGTIAKKIDKEEGQLLVYTENSGFKIINIPHSMMFWARRKQEKTVCLIKPSNTLLLQHSLEALSSQQSEDLYRMAIMVLVMESIGWVIKHGKLGCKYCNRSADLQVMPALYHALKTSRLGWKGLMGEEVYMAKRIASVTKLPGNAGAVHDVVIPRKLVRGLIQQIYNHKDMFAGPELTENEYFKNFAKDCSINGENPHMKEKKAIFISSILAKYNPGARE